MIKRVPHGKLAKEWCNVELELQVLQSPAGFYIGTEDSEGPCSRESMEYFATHYEGLAALKDGSWTQRDKP